MKRIAESTVRRLSLYLRFLEDYESRGLPTISSDELAGRGGTTSAQVRKDLSFFGSFGKRGLGYSVPELSSRLREILGLGREWRVYIVGAGKVGAALASYRGFRQRGFHVVAVYDSDPKKNADARPFTHLTYIDALNMRVGVMDSTAMAMCMDNDLPIFVVNLWHEGTLEKVVHGEAVGTMITA